MVKIDTGADGDYDDWSFEELKELLRENRMPLSGTRAELVRRIQHPYSKEIYKKMTVAELKRELRARKLNLPGTKIELIEKLTDKDWREKTNKNSEIQGELNKEPSYGYRVFLNERLENYIPYDRQIVYYVYEKEKQSIADRYNLQLKIYKKRLKRWEKKFVREGNKYAKGWLGRFLDDGIYINTIEALKKRYPRWEAESIKIIGPRPQKPEKPDNYPEGKPTIRKTRRNIAIRKTNRHKRSQDDEYYDEYLVRQRKNQTEVACPICNSLIQFTDVRKPPFEDKCESCDYSFTFIYKKRAERYKSLLGGKSRYIPYDGIKPTKPRAPFKGEHISGVKRQPIPQDVKDKVWNRDEGKCTQCGSNENLEFDHIIPVSKGGANTYRNIQLLCEVCNREKSDNIG